MAIKRDTPLSATPDPGNMQSYGKYEGPKMKASKVAPLNASPVDKQKLANNINSGEQRRASQADAMQAAKTKENKKYMKIAAAGIGVLGAASEIYERIRLSKPKPQGGY
jgi:hypothetical protein